MPVPAVILRDLMTWLGSTLSQGTCCIQMSFEWGFFSVADEIDGSTLSRMAHGRRVYEKFHPPTQFAPAVSCGSNGRRNVTNTSACSRQRLEPKQNSWDLQGNDTRHSGEIQVMLVSALNTVRGLTGYRFRQTARSNYSLVRCSLPLLRSKGHAVRQPVHPGAQGWMSCSGGPKSDQGDSAALEIETPRPGPGQLGPTVVG